MQITARLQMFVIAIAALVLIALAVVLREPDNSGVRDADVATDPTTGTTDKPPAEGVSDTPSPTVAKSSDAPEPASGADTLPAVAEQQHLLAEREEDSKPQLLAGELPHYLDRVLRPVHVQRDPRGCKTYATALIEMAEEARDELWAARMERELGDLLGRHPLGFRVTVSCRATICQATDYGDIEDLENSGNEGEARAYWDAFRDALRSGSMADEIGRLHGFAGNYSPEPDKHIAGYLLVGVGRRTSGEPAYCDD